MSSTTVACRAELGLFEAYSSHLRIRTEYGTAIDWRAADLKSRRSALPRYALKHSIRHEGEGQPRREKHSPLDAGTIPRARPAKTSPPVLSGVNQAGAGVIDGDVALAAKAVEVRVHLGGVLVNRS